ncbi:lipoprotein LpqH [Mycolicibacterium sp. XJ1819]
MKQLGISVAITALITGGGTACSSEQPQARQLALPPGTAELSIDGHRLDAFDSVQCAPVGPLTTIMFGDDGSGLTMMVSNQGEPIVDFVRVRGLTGFDGTYTRNLEGDATLAITDTVYQVNGTLVGYGDQSYERTTRSFHASVSC